MNPHPVPPPMGRVPYHQGRGEDKGGGACHMAEEDAFRYQESEGFIEGCRVRDLAERFGTPLYLYSENAIRERVACFQKVFAEISPIIRYSCKANSNPHLLKIQKESGCGADVISPGELSLALYAGFTPERLLWVVWASRVMKSPLP